MPAPDAPGNLRPRVLVSLAVLTACALASQVLLTRLLSAVLAYHFTFLAVSLSLVGTGAGAMYVYLSPRRFAGAVTDHLSRWGLGFGLALIVLPVGLAQIELTTVGSAGWSLRFAIACMLAAIPPFAAGVVVALALSRYSERIGAVYGADLLGAGLGALAAVPLMWWVSAPALIVVLGIVACGTAVGFGRVDVGRYAGAVAAAGVAILLASPFVPLIELDSGYEMVEGTSVFERWTPLSRVIGVSAPQGERFGMVLYDRVYAPIPVVSAGVDLTWLELRTGLQSVPYRFSGPGRALIIGGGGGRDIHTARSELQSPIDVIELNEGIVKVVDEDLAAISGSPYSLPGVETTVGDGRSMLAARATLYDHIQLGFTDTLSANAAQGFALMENNLYTVEAFRDYFAHLRPGGILSVSRLYDFVGPEVLRLTVLALAALRKEGVVNPRDHIFVMKGRELGGADTGTLLARLEPFDAQDLQRLRYLARLRGGQVVYAPDGAAGGEWDALVKAGNELFFCRTYPLDVCPPTDDRPFFFNMSRLSPGGGIIGWYWGGVTPFSLLMLTLAILSVLSLLAFAVPLAMAQGPAPPPSLVGYFALIGVGYILVELVLIQHFVLFLGFPTYALSVVLAGLLSSSGLGAFLSGRVSVGRPLSIVLTAAFVVLCVGALNLQPFLRALIDLPLATRVLIALAVLAPVGGLLGFAMPLGLRRLEAVRPGSIPYAWGINGIASVLASVLGVAIAMQLGFRVTGLVAAACYLGALVLVAAGRRR